MKTNDLHNGLRVFNRGDMANIEHFGTITKVGEMTRWGRQVEITPDPDNGLDLDPYWIPASGVGFTDSGNGTTRIVTAAAHAKFRQEQMAGMIARYAN